MSKEKFKYTKKFLEKVKNGDIDATTLLYEDAKDIAYNKAYSILNNHHDAEDIAEDSVLRAIEKIDTIKKPSEFPAWRINLRTISRKISQPIWVRTLNIQLMI